MTTAEKLIRAKADIDAVYEVGKAAGGDKYYDTFWDSYQKNGERNRYDHAFSGTGWNNETFKPKYDIKWNETNGTGYGAYMIFRFAQIEGSLPDILKELGVTLDWTNNVNINYAFQGCIFTNVGEIITGNAANDSAFNGANKLETIEGLTSSTGTFTKLSSTFTNCKALKNITFNGEIQCNIDLHWSTGLTNASLNSILTALTKDASLASGKSCTLATNHEATIEADTELSKLYNAALNAGWKFNFI